MFKITEGKGYHMTFANGWTVSVQWGNGNYCDNRNGPHGADSATAEVAAWDAAGNWHKFEHDSVDGYYSPDKVLAFMTHVAALPMECNT